MKIILTLIALITLSSFSYGQHISPDVLASSGAHFSNNDVQLNWTIGETVIETFQNTNEQLTQGFHQTSLTITQVIENDQGLKIKVYPNPVREILYVDLDRPVHKLSMTLSDATGKPVWKDEINGQRRIKIHSSEYCPGLYFLQVINNSGTINKLYKIIKTK